MIDQLNVHAAIAARDGIEAAIRSVEARIKIKLDDVNPAAKDYFVEMGRIDRAAIEQLKDLRSLLHKRAFDAHLDYRNPQCPPS